MASYGNNLGSSGQNPLLARLTYPPVLSQHGYFKDSAFINYLDYLQYWKQQKYAKFLRYPQCLHFLELLQSEQFRREIANTPCAKFIDEQVLLHWHHYNKKRTKTTEQLLSNTKEPQKASHGIT
ncbi:mediator of RNA polymerase II transcription subunit 31-like isoform X2 [Dysidea avara]|uniref:mediator of RNA polymerase II transcription subunit 31-like isoform X2 n=1 Tax=Dysidea avara TaxID=196820 RepID=UPI00331968A0